MPPVGCHHLCVNLMEENMEYKIRIMECVVPVYCRGDKGGFCWVYIHVLVQFRNFLCIAMTLCKLLTC